MPTRKFFVGDVVEIASTSKYASSHSWGDDDIGAHKGIIRQTTIGKRKDGWNSVTNYTVDCECGHQIHPVATDLNLVAVPSDPAYVPVTHEATLKHFLITAGIPEDPTMTPEEQVKTCLDSVRPKERYVLAMRFGIAGVLGTEYTHGVRKTLAAIGDEYGVTRERIRQIEREGLRRAIRNNYVA